VSGVLLAAGIASCATVTESPPGASPSVHVTSPTDVVLAVGTSVMVDSSLEIRFTDVPADSRCPASVVCVWEGDGEVVLTATAGEGQPVPVHLHTTLDPNAASVGGYHVTLLDLMPYPDVPGPIALDAYAVRLGISRLIR
jgi:hypothetical protein